MWVAGDLERRVIAHHRAVELAAGLDVLAVVAHNEPMPRTRCRPSADTPVFCEVTNHTAANHVVNGNRDRWKIVPAVTEVRR